MLRWEYNALVFNGDIQDAVPYLDADGAQGWEVVYVQPGPYGITYLMKRPLPVENFVEKGDAPVKHNHSTRFLCSRSCPQHGTVNEINT
jgi:hypothetical protein